MRSPWVYLFLVILLLVSFSSCSPQPEPPVSPKPLDSSGQPPSSPTAAPVEVNPTSTLSPSPTVPSLDSHRTHYLLDVTIDFVSHIVQVQELISYTNRSPVTLGDIVLMVEPMNYPDVFQLKTLSWGAGRPENGQSSGTDLIPIQSLSFEGNILIVHLPQSLSPGESIQMDFNFELQLPSPVTSPELRPVPFGYTSRQTNLVDWYLYIPPYDQSAGWLAHPPSYYGEHQVYESSDFEVRLRFNPNQENLVVAASAPDEGSGGLHSYHLQAARNFALSISDQYLVTSQVVQGVTIMSYSLPFHDEAGKHSLQTTVDAFTLLSAMLAPYPHQSLSVVEADFLDGMEYDGLYFLSNGFYNLYSGSPADYLTAIAAHETAHQWWYGMVGNDQALEPWLDEALCTYNEYLFYETFHPEALDWWWTYRIDYYEPSGWVDTTIYNPDESPTPYRSYRSAVYLNGARFLSDLRSTIGDSAFFAFLKDYTFTHNESIVSADQFFDTLAKHTKEDISYLREQYFKPR